MTYFDIFNGDADGICSLLQLRAENPLDSTLITGVKRDISLVKQVAAQAGDSLTILDISFDKNRDAVVAALAAGADVFYVDHHFPGDIPEHPGLTTLIDTASETSTCALVNQYLKGARAGWAAVGCYGDNLDNTAEAIAKTLGYTPDLARWKELGILINYNGYGAEVADLHFAPDALYRRLSQFGTPDEAMQGDHSLIEALQGAYADDMRKAEESPRLVEDDVIAVIELPDEPWARRVSGVYGNQLANYFPDRAHAVVTDIPDGYLVSVRAPLNNRTGADEVCRMFETGGGRPAAAGINCLPGDEIDTLVDALRRRYE